MAAAAAADRTQQPAALRSLLTKRDRVRTRLRADHRTYTAARELAAELPALRNEIDFADVAGRAFAGATGYLIT
ncbi:hypothetical protein DKM18_17370, partial [Mycobacterium tuberculosis variant bovis]